MAEDEMTIDDLARAAGATTRNVRAYQTRGLLPPPRMVGRVGYYGQGHLARLKYIANLLQRGFSLAAIHALLKAWQEGRSVSDILGFEEALSAPWSGETPEVLSRSRLEEMFPEAVEDEELVGRAINLGLLVPEGDDFNVRSPRLVQVGAEMVAGGIPLAVVLDQHEILLADMRRAADRFVRLFDRFVWEPYVAAGLPGSGLAHITETLRRLRPTVSVAVQAVLEQAMDEAVAASTAESVRRLVARRGPAQAS
ncbi:MAG: MerR family transcriptional regulator [Actinomycetota bacterium]